MSSRDTSKGFRQLKNSNCKKKYYANKDLAERRLIMSRLRGNSLGGITKVKDGRKKPYRVRVTVSCSYDEEAGKMKQEVKTLGYFKTRAEAEKALCDYIESPYDLSSKVMTFKELYEKWSEAYFPTLSGESSIRTITSAYKYCEGLNNMKLKDIGEGHLEDCLTTGYVVIDRGKDKGKKRFASDNTKCKMKSLFNLMFDYAYKRKLVKENVARKFTAKIYQEKAEEGKREVIPFSEAEIELLWKYVDEVPFADMVLIGIYTGFRPRELAELKVCNVFLDENKIIGGMKTKAGTDRHVPIHPRIKHLVEKRYIQATERFKSERLFNDARGQQGTWMTYDKFRRRFEKVLSELGIKNTGHAMRHTFITRARKAGVDIGALKRIVGHTLKGDITESIYNHPDFDDLYYEICKIEGDC